MLVTSSPPSRRIKNTPLYLCALRTRMCRKKLNQFTVHHKDHDHNHPTAVTESYVG